LLLLLINLSWHFVYQQLRKAYDELETKVSERTAELTKAYQALRRDMIERKRREEEKLARDVYIKLSTMYPDHPIFGNIDDSEQRHTEAVRDMLVKYGLDDPNTNDNVGVYTGEGYGWYFTEKFHELIERASISELEALYVGAFIEELDMMDINQCPRVIVETDNDINDVTECGRVYTDNADIDNLYASLLDGSDSHLEAYVRNIERYIGKGNYQAQVLPQAQVDDILGR